jgi:pimeloyl-ACP methyl ester carboxylesterase
VVLAPGGSRTTRAGARRGGGLPCDDDSAGLSEYTDVALDAIGDRTDLILVAQSMGGFTAAVTCLRWPTRRSLSIA